MVENILLMITSIIILLYILVLFLLPIVLSFVFYLNQLYKILLNFCSKSISFYEIKLMQIVDGNKQFKTFPEVSTSHQYYKLSEINQYNSAMNSHIAFRNRNQNAIQKMDILIPAHNEELYLEKTIKSVRSSCEISGIKCRIIVGLDNCDDRSIDIASSHADVIVGVSFQSKWKTLNYLVKLANAEWVAFVDCGTIWTAEFVKTFAQRSTDHEIIYIAPGYQQDRASFLQKISWRIESKLKFFENNLGGPISVHGATIVYRLKFLKATLRHLGFKDWLNDDVIIPLSMRALFPKKRGLYLPMTPIFDLPVLNLESKRRTRISLGNLEILDYIERRGVNLSFTLKMLWMRRQYRIFWAYFLLFVGLEITILLPVSLNFKVLLFILGCLVLFKKRVFRVSLLAPFRFLKMKQIGFEEFRKQIKWH